MKTFLAVAAVILLGGLAYYFYPTEQTIESGDQAKIDINQVCEGALAYMTFENGAAAEAWVQECKEGKHPDAIDQWKVQMGITDDRAI